MSKRVAGLTAIVTGGASGMGRAGATLLAAEGAKVVVADINEAGGARVTQAIRDAGGEATFVPLDVRSLDSVKASSKQRCRTMAALTCFITTRWTCVLLTRKTDD